MFSSMKIAGAALAASCASASMGNVTVNYASSSQYTYKVSQVPDFDQRRDATPNDGSMYCAPTGALNWAAYLSGHGYPFVSPGWGNWQSEDLYPLATINQVAMGLSMGTDPSGGTNLEGMLGGQGAWFGNSHFIHFGINASGFSSPTFDTLANLALSGAVVMVRVGWYDTSDYPFIDRTGGHIVCLTKAARSGSDRTIGINDPASDDGDLDEQSTFSRETYPCATEFVVADGYFREYTKMVGYGSGYIDGFRAIMPLYGITNIPLTLNTIKIKKLVLLGSEQSEEITLTLKGDALLSAIGADPTQLWYMHKTGAAAVISNIEKLNLVTGESTPVVTEVGLMSAMTVGRQGLLYYVNGSTLTCLDTSPKDPIKITKTLSMPVHAMEYDDVNDEIVLFDHIGKKLQRIAKGLNGDPKTLNMPPGLNLPGKPVLAIHPLTGNPWIGSSENAKIFEVTTDRASGVVTHPLLLPATPGPKSLQFDDLGRIFICDGSVKGYIDDGDGTASPMDPLISPFIGLASDAFFRLPRSRNNFDPAEMLDPAQIETVLPTQFAPSLPDCKEDVNGDDMVDGADLGALLADWETTSYSDSDLNQDGVVNGADLGVLLSMWGACPG
jgi:hypothetical protein